MSKPAATDIVIVGAGAAGIGMGVLLQKMGLDFIILEKESIGASFLKWPSEMRFISPSFTGNSFGCPDLNSISPDTSPAFTLETEHPTGHEYAAYLKKIAKYYHIPVLKKTNIKKVEYENDQFVLTSQRGKVSTPYLIWAAGEFQYPRKKAFPGSNHCRHTSKVRSWEEVDGDDICIIGGYESGMDAAIQLARLGKKSHIIDAGDPLSDTRSDSSYSLSPYTKERLENHREAISLTSNTQIRKITHDGDTYVLHTDDGDNICSLSEPLLANGFEGSLSLIKNLFEWENDNALLTENDESTLYPNLFLSGPQVCHSKALFCFIYKFRQRFPIIAECIAQRQGLDQNKKVLRAINECKKMNFYLKDLSCCENECSC